MANILFTQDEQTQIAEYVDELKRILKEARSGRTVSLTRMRPIVARVCIDTPMTKRGPITLEDADQNELDDVIKMLEALLSEAREGREVELPSPLNPVGRVCFPSNAR
jgi:hypothetical protein